MNLQRGWGLHLALTSLGAGLWVGQAQLYDGWWPGAVYLCAVLIKEFVHKAANEFGWERTGRICMILQRVFYGGLVLAAAMAIDESEMLSLLTIGLMVYGAIRHLGHRRAWLHVVFVKRTDECLAGLFGTLALTALLFAPESIGSQAWMVSCLMGLFLLVKPWVENRRMVAGRLTRNERATTWLLLGYDGVWLALGMLA